MPDLPILLLLSLLAASVGTLGGIGGAMFLVPVLVLLGVEPTLAAPLGLLAVGAGSLAAAPRQLSEGLVHHRLAVLLEVAASAGAIAGAVIGSRVSARFLTLVLASLAVLVGLLGLRRSGMRNVPQGHFSLETPGEWPGTLSGAYRLAPEQIVPYQARRVPQGMLAMVGAGIVAGLAGVGGGFVKTPAMREIMGIPIKVAAATTTFTVGVTAATGLIVFAGQGRVDYEAGAAIVIGAVAGGVIGARIQDRVPPGAVRLVLSLALVAVGVVLAVSS